MITHPIFVLPPSSAISLRPLSHPATRDATEVDGLSLCAISTKRVRGEFLDRRSCPVRAQHKNSRTPMASRNSSCNTQSLSTTSTTGVQANPARSTPESSLIDPELGRAVSFKPLIETVSSLRLSPCSRQKYFQRQCAAAAGASTGGRIGFVDSFPSPGPDVSYTVRPNMRQDGPDDSGRAKIIRELKLALAVSARSICDGHNAITSDRSSSSSEMS
mmetsp:Transcript_12312/g.25004  ORF Transcript_12312/g.25004 Transcript_12312/m.25004 type:complete len:217 (+) Transcript_12312:321-971(+)